MPGAGIDRVVAVAALHHVLAELVGELVVAVAAQHRVVARAALENVVAGVAVEGVVALAGDQPVDVVGTAQHDVVGAGVADAVGDLDHLARGPGIGIAPLDDVGRSGEYVARQVLGASVAHHEVGERGLLQLGEEVEAGGAGEVVEPVVVLQRLHLGLEDEVEGRAQEAAERHLLLGKAADPEVDIVQAGRGDAVGTRSPRRLAVQEVEASGGASIATMTMASAAARLSASVVASRIVWCRP